MGSPKVSYTRNLKPIFFSRQYTYIFFNEKSINLACLHKRLSLSTYKHTRRAHNRFNRYS